MNRPAVVVCWKLHQDCRALNVGRRAKGNESLESWVAGLNTVAMGYQPKETLN